MSDSTVPDPSPHSWRTWALEQVNDLTVLEINTIVKADITARPIGSLADALLEVVDDYTAQVQRIARGQAVTLPEGVGIGPVDADRLARLSASAAMLLARTDTAPLPDLDQMVLKRMRGNCIELAGVLSRVHARTGRPVPLARATLSAANRALATASPMDQARVRKIRDLGTEVVVAQSRIHLDGDVVTRISPAVLDDRLGPALLDVHREGVDRSVAFWSQLSELGLRVLRQVWDVGRDLLAPRP